MSKKSIKWVILIFILFIFVIPIFGEDQPDIASQLSTLSVGIDTVWVLFTAFLVFFMNLGFAMVESGLCRSKNAVNILTKNFIVFAISSVSFWIIGWGLMFGDGNIFVGLKNLFFVNFGKDDGYSAITWTKVPLWAKFFFQLVFAGTAATIVSGAVAERIKFLSFIIFSFILVGLIYPITGHWIWGGGWLASLGFFDFAGSTVVHSVGGWAALAGVLLLGPRIGKYRADGSVNPIMGHNMAIVTLGGIVLWFGWFGFNPGSTMGVGDGTAIAHIAVTTNTSAATAILASTVISWLVLGKPDLSMIINGALAGLVAITAPCAFVDVGGAAVIGLVAGTIVVFAVIFFDKLKIDDPVGALSVHLVNGIWGTLSLGLFAVDKITGTATGNGLFNGGGLKLLGVQALGVITVGGFVFGVSLLVWFLIKVTLKIRVSRQEEIGGLDIGEHGSQAYSGFQIID
jgi:ammonium transporter, Amt family